MRSIRHVVRWAVLLLLFGLLTACFARFREMGTTASPSNGQVLAPAPTALATVDPTVTPFVTGTQLVTATYIEHASGSLGVVVDENMKVLHIEVDSAAEKAGLQVGDLLDTLDGLSFVKDREKVRTKISEPNQEPTKPKTMTLKFKRVDKDIVVDVSIAPRNPQPVEGTATPVPTPQDYF